MGIRFVPHGLPVLVDDTPLIGRGENRLPSGWWIFPALIVGVIECVALIGWMVA